MRINHQLAAYMSDHWRADVELVSLILDVKFEMRGPVQT